jgi:hypothetical protein
MVDSESIRRQLLGTYEVDGVDFRVAGYVDERSVHECLTCYAMVINPEAHVGAVHK